GHRRRPRRRAGAGGIRVRAGAAPGGGARARVPLAQRGCRISLPPPRRPARRRAGTVALARAGVAHAVRRDRPPGVLRVGRTLDGGRPRDGRRCACPVPALAHPPGARYDVEGGHGLTARRARGDASRVQRASQPSIVRELWDFLRVRKKWWLGPIVLVLVLFGAL